MCARPLISLTAIPISILVTAAGLQMLRPAINTMTLGGLAIAIGELVDDAVVDVENIFRRLKENRQAAHRGRSLEVIAAASQEVRSGIVYATVIIILVFVPLFALSGIEGRLFAPLGIAYIVSILASLVTSITVTPVLAYYLLRAHAQAGATATAWLVRAPEGGNRGCWRGRSRTAAVRSSAPLCRAVWPRLRAALLPRAFLPPFNEGTLTRQPACYNPGISLAESQPARPVAEQLHPAHPRGRSPSAAAPAAPSSTSMPKASHSARSTST